MIVGVIWTGRTLGAEAVNAVSMFFGAIVGIIAGYVGGKFEDRKPLPPPVDKWPPDKPP
jgi:ABC-type dipeptide/oligopeptide/nickel transport system permease subunit